jgi:heme exporter protein CcmD
MLGLGPHAAYILVSYGMTGAVLIGLSAWALASDRSARRDVQRLEALRRERPGS